MFDKRDKYARDPNGMAAFGKMTVVSDLPPRKVLAGYIKKAAALNDEGVKIERQRTPRQPLPVPPALAAALARDTAAKAAFDALPPSHQREYNEWIGDAKTDATRDKRVAQAIQWIADGKSRNWKYQR